jgi:predicted NUDIX family NTP pyrophosphohydrolase
LGPPKFRHQWGYFRAEIASRRSGHNALVSRKESAGLLMFRRSPGGIEVLLAHPGGPFWKDRDAGAWTLPKGGIHAGEEAVDSAIREFREETGLTARGPFLPLGSVTQRGGKTVHAWAFEGDCDPSQLTSVTCTTEWPPRSGKRIEVPEIDRCEFFSLAAARRVINVAQVELLDRLEQAVSAEKR